MGRLVKGVPHLLIVVLGHYSNRLKLFLPPARPVSNAFPAICLDRCSTSLVLVDGPSYPHQRH